MFTLEEYDLLYKRKILIYYTKCDDKELMQFK